MDLSFLLMKQIGVMMTMVFAGWLIVRLKLLKTGDSRPLSVLVLYIVVPCVILTAYDISFNRTHLLGLGWALLGACLVQFLLMALERISRPLFHLNPVESGSLVYPNVGNLIIPLVLSTFGPEWVFYCSAYLTVQLIAMWTHGRALYAGMGDWRKIILNVNILAVCVGLVLFLTGTRLPPILGPAVHTVGGTIGPLSMILIGMLLAGIPIRRLFCNGRAWFILLLRMIVFPLAVACVFLLLNAQRIHPHGVMILTILLLGASASPAVTITQFVQVYRNKDSEIMESCVLNLLGVLVCILTIPLMIFFYRTFAGG